MTRDEGAKALISIGQAIADEMGLNKCDVKTDKSCGIWGEKMTEYLESLHGDCSTVIRWTRKGQRNAKPYVEFDYRFSHPRICVRDNNGGLASLELSDWSDSRYKKAENEIKRLEKEEERELSYSEKSTFYDKYKVHTGKYRPSEMQVFIGEKGTGLTMQENLLKKWKEVNA